MPRRNRFRCSRGLFDISLVLVVSFLVSVATVGCAERARLESTVEPVDATNDLVVPDLHIDDDSGGDDFGVDLANEASRDITVDEDAVDMTLDEAPDRTLDPVEEVFVCEGETCGPLSDCCIEGDVCRFDHCIPPPTICAGDDDCDGDRYCEEEECIPYEVGPRGSYDPECSRLIEVGLFQPAMQCEWSGPGAEDPLPDYASVISNPVVISIIIDSKAPSPSVIFHSAGPSKGYGSMRYGAVRILNGRTCAQEAVLDHEDGRVEASTSPAAGDIDVDGVPEIVSCAIDGGLVAFDKDEDGEWQVLWHSTNADGSRSTLGYPDFLWNGPSIHDLDNDGSPEIIFEGVVHNSDGEVLGSGAAPYPYYFRGNFSVIDDIDLDGVVELVTGPMVYEYDDDSSEFVTDPAFTGAGGAYGLVAIGDFGEFPGMRGDGVGVPEITVIGGTARVQTVGGDVVFGPFALPGGGTGGPPTVGDFDGDGRPEIGAAGRGAFTVFDLDCIGTPEGCSGEGIRWTRPSQDASSSCTGASIFDFEGDGRAEAIYADECFVRVYDGATGDVLFSAWRPSGTWYENPIVADVDGDLNSELVLQSNGDGSTCPATDPIFAGLRCEESDHCSGETPLCDEGLCRCTIDDDCGGADYGCRAPLDGTPGTGNVCRPINRGASAPVRIYRDRGDRWVNSRMVWNQHAYNISNVNEDGSLPSTSAREPNWQNPDYNNFRQNVQGDLDPTALPDITSSARNFAGVCDEEGSLELTALICNRGLKTVGAGVSVRFYDGAPPEGAVICETETPERILSESCVEASCVWTEVPTDTAHTVHVVADDSESGDGLVECNENNNTAVLEILCPEI